MNPDLQAVADDLFQMHVHGGTVEPVRARLPEGDVAAAYAVQDANTRRWVAEGWRIGSRKIGLTSLVLRGLLGVDQPDFGMPPADMGGRRRGTVDRARPGESAMTEVKYLGGRGFQVGARERLA